MMDLSYLEKALKSSDEALKNMSGAMKSFMSGISQMEIPLEAKKIIMKNISNASGIINNNSLTVDEIAEKVRNLTKDV